MDDLCPWANATDVLAWAAYCHSLDGKSGLLVTYTVYAVTAGSETPELGDMHVGDTPRRTMSGGTNVPYVP